MLSTFAGPEQCLVVSAADGKTYQIEYFNRRGRAGELLIALAGVGGAQVVKALQAMRVQQLARRADLPVEKPHVALIGGEQVAAAGG